MKIFKDFFSGQEKLSIAFFIYGFVVFFVLRYLMAAPLITSYVLSSDVYWIYMVCVKFVSIIVCVSLLFGIWKCSAKSDGLPRWAARISYCLFTTIIVFADGAVLQTMLMY